MTSALWLACGLAIGAAVLHAAFGLTRPLDRTYLSFACMMALVAPYLYFEWALYRATTVDEAVAAFRYQVLVGHGFLACILVFVPAYTRARIPRGLMAAFWIGLALLFAANLLTPYGAWFSGPPVLVRSTFRGEPITSVIAPPLAHLQYVHTVYILAVFVLTFRCALDLLRRDERQRGVVLAIALSTTAVQHVVDVIRDAVGGAWPYTAEFALVTWGMIMSIQLALDYRANRERLQETLGKAEQHAADLADLVAASMHVRDKLNTPLQTLEIGLALCTTDGDGETVARLQHEVVELATLGRNVEQAAQECAIAPTQERAK